MSEAMKVDAEQWEALPFDDILCAVPGSFEGFDSLALPAESKGKKARSSKGPLEQKFHSPQNVPIYKIEWNSPKNTRSSKAKIGWLWWGICLAGTSLTWNAMISSSFIYCIELYSMYQKF